MHPLTGHPLTGQALQRVGAKDSKITQVASYLLVYDLGQPDDPLTAPARLMAELQNNIIHTRLSLFHNKLRRLPLMLERPCWVPDDDFRLQNHLGQVALPKPGDWDKLCQVVSQINNHPMDMSSPLWEALLISELRQFNGHDSNYCVLFLRIHRSALVGIHPQQILRAIHGLMPAQAAAVGATTDVATTDASPAWRSLLSSARGAMVARAHHSLRLTGNLRDLALEYRRSRQRHQQQPLSDIQNAVQVPVTRFQKSGHNYHVNETLFFNLSSRDLATLKRSGHSLQVLVLSLLSLTLKKYLLAKDELPTAPLMALCRFETCETQACGEQVRPEGGIPVRLATDVSYSIDQVLSATQDEVGAAIDAQDPGRDDQDFLEKIPASWIELAAITGWPRNLTCHSQPANIAITSAQLLQKNLQKKLSLGGCCMTGFARMTKIEPGVGMHVISDAIKTDVGMTLSISLCTSLWIIPDIQQFSALLKSEFTEILNHMTSRSVVMAKRTSPVPSSAPSSGSSANP